MPTKKTTKSKKGKPQPPTQQQQALTASHVHLGPPFAGSGAYPYPAAWGIFPAPDGRSVPCPGFWGFTRHYPTTGGIVAQLGAEPGTGSAGCTLYAGYQYVFKPTVAGDHLITATLNLGPVTRRPRYGRVQIAGVLQIMGPGGHWADFYEDLPSNAGVTLAITPRIQANQIYTLRFGVAPIVENVGYQSYGEAILNSAEVKQYLPYGAQAAQLTRASASPGHSILDSLLAEGDERDIQNISLHEAATFGVGYSS